MIFRVRAKLRGTEKTRQCVRAYLCGVETCFEGATPNGAGQEHVFCGPAPTVAVPKNVLRGYAGARRRLDRSLRFLHSRDGILGRATEERALWGVVVVASPDAYFDADAVGLTA